MEAAGKELCVLNPSVWELIGDENFDNNNLTAWSSVLRILSRLCNSEEGLAKLLPKISHVLIVPRTGQIDCFYGGTVRVKLVNCQPSRRRLGASKVLQTGEFDAPNEIEYIQNNRQKLAHVVDGCLLFRCEKCGCDFKPSEGGYRFIFTRQCLAHSKRPGTFERGVVCHSCYKKATSADSMLRGYHERKERFRRTCAEIIDQELTDNSNKH